MQDATWRDLRIVNSANVAGEQQSLLLPRDLHRHFHHRRSYDVGCAYESEREIRPQLLVLIEIHGHELRQARLRLFERVERQRRIVFRCFLLIVKRGVFFLQVTRIRKQDAAQIDRRLRGVNRAAVAFLHQSRNPPAVIEMCMRQNYCIDFIRWNGRLLPISFAPFFLSLEKSAIDQHLEACSSSTVVVRVDQMFRPGYRTGRAEKLYVGQEFFLCRKNN